MKESHLNISAVVFDATGTLIEPFPPADIIYHRVAVELGSTQSQHQTTARFAAALKQHFGNPGAMMSPDRRSDPIPDPATSAPIPRSNRSLRREATSEARERSRWQRIVADTICDLQSDQTQRAFEMLWDQFSQAAAWRVFDDIAPTLEQLRRRGLTTAIASNFDHRLHRVVAGIVELQQVDYCFCSAELGFSKPDPRFYQAVAAQLGQPADRLLMVGDDYVNDIRGARAAGWHAVQIDRSRSPQGNRIQVMTDLLNALM